MMKQINIQDPECSSDDLLSLGNIAPVVLIHMLRAAGFVPHEDVSWVGCTEDQLGEIRGELEFDAFRGVYYKKLAGVTFRLSPLKSDTFFPWHSEGLRRRVAWNATKRTKDLFIASKKEQEKNKD